MTTTRKPAPAGPAAVEIAHAVTLPGRPVTIHLSAEEVAAYLKAEGWDGPVRAASQPMLRMWRWRDRLQFVAQIPDGIANPVAMLRDTLKEIADYEGRHPLDVAEVIIARRGGKQADGDDARGKWTRDADEALRLADAASPDWNMGGVDAGDGRKIIADGKVPLDHIRVSTMSAGGRTGVRSITVAQRDADARFIAAARVGWPRDANRVRLLCAEVERLRKGGKPEIDVAVEDLTRGGDAGEPRMMHVPTAVGRGIGL